MDIPNHDQLLDDPLYRRDVIDEERHTWLEETSTRCPKCDRSLEQVAGDYPTGVVAPDGGRESHWQEGWHCERCDLYFDFDEVDAPRDVDEDEARADWEGLGESDE